MQTSMGQLAGVFLWIAFAAWSNCSMSGEPATNDIESLQKFIQSKVPSGWRVEVNESILILTSREMLLDPSRASSLPRGRIRRVFKIYLKVGERITEGEHERRTKSDVPPNSKFELAKPGLPPWTPDFHDDKFGFEFGFPSYVPSNDDDQQIVIDCYKVLQKLWTVYPTSRHRETNYYKSLLDLRG